MLPPFGGEFLTLFIKFFDPAKQELEFLGTIRTKKVSKGFDLIPVLTELKKLATNTAIKIYEVIISRRGLTTYCLQEIKPGMIEPLKMKGNLGSNEIVDGDILCFQLDLNKE